MSELNDKTIPTTQPATNAPGDEPIITNMEKYQNYKTQFERLNRAMRNAFYLEAIVIEYAIMEDRTRAILGYEGNQIIPNNEKEFIGITRKIKKIKNLSQNKKSVIARYFANNLKNKIDLMDEILIWINTKNSTVKNSLNRNSIIHNLLGIIITTKELGELAERGEKLCRELSNRANNYKRMVERHRSESSENTN